MKRTPLKRKAPLRATPNTASTSVKVAKAKCKVCRAPFTRFDMRVKWCSPDCGKTLGEKLLAERKAAQAREEKKKDADKRESLKRLSDLERECRDIAQELARIRDRKDGCISCHMGPNYDGQWHGSHYRAHGNCSSLQVHLWNIHKACAQCNLHKHGNKEGFILGLLAKPGYGRERLDWLDSQPPMRKFTREYLGRYKAVMGKRLRRARAAAKKDC